jgi:hypothetical protein
MLKEDQVSNFPVCGMKQLCALCACRLSYRDEKKGSDGAGIESGASPDINLRASAHAARYDLPNSRLHMAYRCVGFKAPAFPGARFA